jgi:hypothetical protein
MSRTTFALLPLLAVLALLSPGKAVDGPPEGAAGKMVLDEVADGLRKYGEEKDPAKRLGWLKRLAPSRDPRVGVALGETFWKVPEEVWCGATQLVIRYYLKGEVENPGLGPGLRTERWWERNEADLRRRAAQLPR